MLTPSGSGRPCLSSSFRWRTPLKCAWACDSELRVQLHKAQLIFSCFSCFSELVIFSAPNAASDMSVSSNGISLQHRISARIHKLSQNICRTLFVITVPRISNSFNTEIDVLRRHITFYFKKIPKTTCNQVTTPTKNIYYIWYDVNLSGDWLVMVYAWITSVVKQLRSNIIILDLTQWLLKLLLILGTVSTGLSGYAM